MILDLCLAYNIYNSNGDFNTLRILYVTPSSLLGIRLLPDVKPGFDVKQICS